MDDVIIIGGSSHGAELYDYIKYEKKAHNLNRYNVVGILEEFSDNYHRYEFKVPYLGLISEHKIRPECKYIIGVANLKFRKEIVRQFLIQGADIIKYIHPNSYISDTARIGKGVVIAPNVNLGPKVIIGDYTLLNSRCSIGHDTKIGKFNIIAPNACFSGFSEIGEENFFGINSATIPKIKVGNRNKIAAGMTLNKNVGDDEVVFYRFKEKVIAIPKKL